MTAGIGTAIARTGTWMVLVFAFAPAFAQAPASYHGERVMELRWSVRDTPIVLHATASGFIPEQTDRMGFEAAGPMLHKGDATVPPRYRWVFSISMRGTSKPVHVRIEEVGKDADTLLVDDVAPALQDRTWNGQASPECDIVRTAPCAAWIFAAGAQAFVFRATVTFDDGTTQGLYQGAAFYPERMQTLWTDMGVAR